MAQLPSITCLQAFESVARHGSITRASVELNLTQSAVSRQIHQLEALLDVSLFERVRQRVVITDAGKLYLNDVNRVIAGLKDATSRVMACGGNTNLLNLAVLPTRQRSRVKSSFVRAHYRKQTMIVSNDLDLPSLRSCTTDTAAVLAKTQLILRRGIFICRAPVSLFTMACVFALVSFLFPGTAHAQSASTPPMGWNSWNHFGRNVSAADVRAAADALVSSGMKAAGYVYVNIDDGWQGTRDAEGNIRGNDKFPDMKALGDYVHSRGLKLGLYSSPGPKTCANFEGSYGHEEQDARRYASWGVDFLKYDLCSYRFILAEQAQGLSAEQKETLKQAANDPRAQTAMLSRMLQAYSPEEIAMMKAAYEKMHLALEKAGRPIFFSICQYGLGDVWQWGASVGGNAWRTAGDIRDSYSSMSSIGFGQLGIAQFAGSGHWNDPDMLEVGNGGMTTDEYRTHMSLWALLAAPLLAGNDLGNMSPTTLSILTNRDVIAVDQDKLGKQGERVWASKADEIWMKPLQGGAVAVGLFNRSGEPKSITLHFADLGLYRAVRIRDLWMARDLGKLHGSYTVAVPQHGVVMLRLGP